jgi:hypothetical protein
MGQDIGNTVTVLVHVLILRSKSIPKATHQADNRLK